MNPWWYAQINRRVNEILKDEIEQFKREQFICTFEKKY